MTDLVRDNPKAVLGLATGGTPLGLYSRMIEAYRQGTVSFKEVTTFNLDEYVGLPRNHEQSYYSYMQNQLFKHIDISPGRTFIPDSEDPDTDRVCRQYDDFLQLHSRMDIQLLGIGHNGHIGFNEPEDQLISGTHVVKLQETTRQANARFFDSEAEVPTHAITMGIGMILRAKRIMMIVTGKDKADILYDSFRGQITTRCPASILQVHPDVVVLCDKEAAARLLSDESEDRLKAVCL